MRTMHGYHQISLRLSVRLVWIPVGSDSRIRGNVEMRTRSNKGPEVMVESGDSGKTTEDFHRIEGNGGLDPICTCW